MAEELELPRQRVPPASGADDSVRRSAERVHFAKAVLESRGMRENRREQTAEVLRHAFGEAADGVQPLCGLKPLLELVTPRLALLALAHVAHRLHAQRATLLLELRKGHLRGEAGAVLATVALEHRDRTGLALRRSPSEFRGCRLKQLLRGIAVEVHGGLVRF